MANSVIFRLWLLAVVLPYTFYSLFIGVDFATGLRAYWVALWHTLLALDAAWRCLPGREERTKVLALWIAPWVLWAAVAFWLTDAGRFQVAWLTEYRLVSGACIAGSITCGLAAGYGIYRGGKA